MKIVSIGGIYAGTLKITGREGGYFATGKTRNDVIKKLISYI